MRRTVLLGAATILLGCPASPTRSRDAGVADGAPASPALATAAPVPVTDTPEQANPQALAELLAATPSAQLPTTGPDGSTLVGTDTRLAAASDGGAPPPAHLGRPPMGMQVGDPEVLPLLSSPAVERAARELIYWNLMKNCRGPHDEPPPPDMITLVFTIRSDGSIDPASVGATAADKRYESTAECVVREFSASPFRGPPATMRSSARIIVTWPSVD